MKRLTVAVAFAASLTGCSDLATSPDRRPETLRVSPDTVLVVRGQAVQLNVEVLDQDGTAFPRLPTWSPPDWTVSNASLLTLGPDGAGQALEAGESTARVEIAGLSAEAVVRANPTEISVSVPFVYITQSTQRQDGTVPLIAGREGLVRVYVMGGGVNFFRPQVRVTFLNGGDEVHSVLMDAESPSIPDEIEEGDLLLSYDAIVPGEVLQPGVAMVVEVDPSGSLPTVNGSQMRVPAVGSMILNVREAPPFQLRLVPVDQSANGRTTRLNATSITALSSLAHDIFPMGGFDVDIREPYTTAADLSTRPGWSQLISEIRVLRAADASDRYYYGTFNPPSGSGIAGLGYIGFPTSIGVQNGATTAHELGHNFGLPHAPCGGADNADPQYPYLGGRIGRFGYDRSVGELLDPTEYVDLMTYCDPEWISDYNYEKVLAYRELSPWDNPGAGLGDASTVAVHDGVDHEAVLIVWGQIVDGQMTLEPALEWTGRAITPTRPGPYTLEGLDDGGVPVFAISFEPLELDHLDAKHFLFALPADLAQPDRLAHLRLTGPEGTTQRIRTAGGPPALQVSEADALALGSPLAPMGRWDPVDYPLAVVRSHATGRILAISRNGTVPLAPGVGMVDVVLSDGLRSYPADVVQR